MKKHVISSIFLFLLTVCIVACSSGDPPESTADKQQIMKLSSINDARPGDAPAEGAPELPQLVGGAEADERVIQPAANSLLQQMYPNTLVLRGSLQDQRVALTFDDGPDRKYTPQVLDVLKKHDVKATFFLMGSRVQALPGITKRIDQEGHLIGNHTFWHPKLYQESTERMKWEIATTDYAIEQAVGYRTKYFRAPYGGLDERLLESLSNMGLTVVGWSVDSLDWKGLDREKVQHNVLDYAHPGAIILMHSGGHWTQDLSGMVEALDGIITELKKQGLQFVTVSELLNQTDQTM